MLLRWPVCLLLMVVTQMIVEGRAHGQNVSGKENETQNPRLVKDPFFLMWQRAVEALDESYDQWNFRPEETVDSTTFTINYIASLATDGRRRLDRVMILHADPDRDRHVTRSEAVAFLETQIGLKWVTGDPLRLEDGRVLVFSEFLRADTDQNDRISRREFVVAMWDREGADVDFSRMDSNGDEQIDLKEYANEKGPNFRNIGDDFHQADVDSDGRLSRSELELALPLSRKHLLGTNLHAFDDDGDQCLSEQEYRLSMLGNFNYPWEQLPKDRNEDGEISFDEFQFHPRDLFQLQKRYYFHRLDLDNDGLLSGDEFEFKQERLHSLYSVIEQGAEPRLIYENKKYPKLGSPSLRPGGNEVLFHAIPPEGEHQALLMSLKRDGSEVREISHGLMPSWSPQGDRFTCSRYTNGASVWVMRTDGGAAKRIDDGWGSQWSPDGRWIAYRNDNGLLLFDVQSGKISKLLSKDKHPYRYLHPYLAWSPDAETIALFAEKDRSVELLILSVGDLDGTEEEPSYKICFQTTEAVGGELDWRDDDALVFSMFSRERGRVIVYQVAASGNATPVPSDRFRQLFNPVDLASGLAGSVVVMSAAE